MRIISGKHKGRQIQAPKGLPVRPTTDQAKEGLFNILAHRFDIREARVLDCFAGTGNMTYEFISRGAAEVHAVDQNAGCIRFIKQTAQLLGESACIHPHRMRVSAYLSKVTGPFDIIFMDPPYALPDKAKLVSQVFSGGLLAPEGMLILEHGSHESFSELPGFGEDRAYGSSTFSFFS